MAVNESLSKVLDKEWEQKSLAEIAKASPAVLQGLTDERAAKLAEAIGAKTIAELANNKYVKWAQALALLAEFEE